MVSCFFFSSRRRHTRLQGDWSSDVCSSDLWREVSDYLVTIKSPLKAIVAYSGDFEIGGVRRTESDLNEFPSKDIPSKLKQDPYRFLIVANKFVTGFDEPLLHKIGRAHVRTPVTL